MLTEDDEESQKLAADQAALAKAVDAMVESTKEKQGINRSLNIYTDY